MMPGQRWKGWTWPVVLLIVIIALLLAWCHRPEPAVAAMGCPEHDTLITAFDTTIREVPIAPKTSRVPEFHDCQRFRVGNGFGPLVAIWAAQDLDRYFRDSMARSPDSFALAVAGILDFGTGDDDTGSGNDYAPLSIHAGFNCLYLWRTSAKSFEARIVSQPGMRELSQCVGQRAVDRSLIAAPALSVQMTPVPDDGSPGVPPVARWDWDPVARVQYIGIACGNAWCEVGPQGGFTSSRVAAADPEMGPALLAAFEPAGDYTPAEGQRLSTVLVKGWYDQQELEIWNDQGQLVPSGVVGTIVPHPVLQAIATATAPATPTATPAAGAPSFDGKWEPSAYLYVNRAYHGKYLKLEPGVSKMYLCHGSADQCPGASAIDAPTGKDLWWSKLVSPSAESSVVKPVEYNEHGGDVIPAGAARWRWMETDGKSWLRCGVGCCTDR
jgi:hypothetical protein